VFRNLKARASRIPRGGELSFSRIFEVALTVSDRFDGPLQFPSDHCDFHSGIKQRLQFFVLHARPRAAGWAGANHFPFAFRLIESPNRAAFLRITAGERWS
jgi:hypothetical protein